jgi:hypothetical protein
MRHVTESCSPSDPIRSNVITCVRCVNGCVSKPSPMRWVSRAKVTKCDAHMGLGLHSSVQGCSPAQRLYPGAYLSYPYSEQKVSYSEMEKES